MHHGEKRSIGDYNAGVRGDLIIARDVRKHFLHEGRLVEVLKGVNLTIRSGEMVCVVGKSGAGKSTLLHLLGTLDLPTSGTITCEGQDLTKMSSRELASFRNKRLGFVFQFHHLLPEFTALENVMMPGLVRGKRRAELAKRASDLLRDVGLGHRLRHRPGELSGGEQQRVALARAIIMNPALVLADEPTGNLDSGTSDAIHRLFFKLNEMHGTTFLIVTHSRDLAARMPRVVEMADGVVFSDKVQTPDDSYRTATAPDTNEPDENGSVAGQIATGLERALSSDPSPSSPPKANDADADAARLGAALMAAVAKETELPLESLELSMHLEADLGIDDSKRDDIVRALMATEPAPNPAKLAEAGTLEEIVELFLDAR